MDDTRAPEGIDLFDFLYEIWRAKWLFALIVIGCTALAAVPALLPRHQPAVVASEETVAQFGVTIRYFNDPFKRNTGLLMPDFVGLVDPDGKLGLQYAGLIAKETLAEYGDIVKKYDRTYAFQTINQNNSGWVILKLKDGDEALYRSVHEEFLRAAERQFLQAKAFAEGTVESYKALAGHQPAISYVPEPVVLALQFLETPAVQDGTFRFFSFRPLEIKTTAVGIATSTSSGSTKMILLGAIVGFILACVAVMFRIAIQRKMSQISKA